VPDKESYDAGSGKVVRTSALSSLLFSIRVPFLTTVMLDGATVASKTCSITTRACLHAIRSHQLGEERHTRPRVIKENAQWFGRLAALDESDPIHHTIVHLLANALQQPPPISTT
jgi:hypothetical protein